MPVATYRIHAVRYTHRKCTSSEAFSARPMTSSVGRSGSTDGPYPIANNGDHVMVATKFTQDEEERRLWRQCGGSRWTGR
jgi:hypothetical protein